MSDISKITDALRVFTGSSLKHPVYLIFFITSRCMGHCRHCFYWEHINQIETPLTVDEVDRIAGSMGHIYQLTLTGGEPFLREDFTDLVQRFYAHNKVYHLGVATSGYHPERIEKDVRRILETCPELKVTIGLPIEGPAQLNNEIRGVPDFFERTVETFFRLKKLKQRKPQLNLLIDITISALNRGRLDETYRYILNKLEPDLINAILIRGNPRDPDSRIIDTDEVSKLFSLMEQDIRDGRVKGYRFFPGLLHAKDMILRQTALDIFMNNTYVLPCEAGRTIGVLMPEGDVYACELGKNPIGNLRMYDYNFPALWKSPEAVRIRKEIIDTRCSCYHQCFLSNTLLWNPKTWPRLLREWVKLI